MSIVEVAKKAGVSNSTVSRVINNVPGVADPLRERVLAAITELGYRPSKRRPGPQPASLRGTTTGNVLLLVAGIEASELYRMPLFPSILHGVETTVAAAGMNLVVAGLNDDGPLPTILNKGQCDGVIMLGRFEGLAEAARQRLKEIPTIVLLRTFEQMAGPFDRVLYNNRAVGPIAAKYLLSKGHEHAAFLSGGTDHVAFEERRKMFGECMRASGAKVTDLLVVDHLDASPHVQIEQLVEKLKRLKPAVTALCATSDYILPFLYRALVKHGISPQVDLDIIACDNDRTLLSTIEPQPSTIEIRPECIGQLAVRQLQWRLSSGSSQGPMTVSVEPHLIAADAS